jgi:hypothetical protein
MHAYVKDVYFLDYLLAPWSRVLLEKLINLLRINGLYMFPALLAHPQEMPHSSTRYIVCALYQWAAPGLN